MKGRIEICVSSPPDREKLVADVLVESDDGVLEQLLEINQEHDELQIEIYPRRSGEPWVFPYDVFLELLEKARKRLVGDR